jgi:branched-chain amino acid transport system permease protein
MDFSIGSILIFDGLTKGSIYALLALATVLVFAVTRVIFIPQGEFVAFGALTLAMLQNKQVPGTVWLLVILALLSATQDFVDAVKRRLSAMAILRNLIKTIALPFLAASITVLIAPLETPLAVQVIMTLFLVTMLGGLIYKVAYESLAEQSVLVLLIVSVGVHFALTGLGLLFFGAEGFRTPLFWDYSFNLGPINITGQSIIIIAAGIALSGLLYLFFEKTLRGKALLATAVNPLGARIVGISATGAGKLSFTLAAFIGGLSGLLIGPTTTLFYDSGFLIGLKGFVAAVFAGLASYPLAIVGAIAVGTLESFSSFWASAYKEVIVFTLILPVLLWRSLSDPHAEEH